MTTPNSEGVASALGLHSTPGSNSLQKAGTYLQEKIAALLHQWAWHDIGLQFLIVIVSGFVGLFLSKRIRRVCLSYLPEPGNTAMSAYFKRLGLAFIANVSFSFLSGVVLAIGAYVMVSVFGYSPVSMVVLRLAYSLFFAYALLCLCLGFLTVITGENVITPGMRRVFTIAFWVVAVLKIMGVLEDIVTYLDQTAIPIGGGSLTIWTLILAIVTVLLTIGIANWLAHLVHQLVNNIGSLSPKLKVVLNRVISIVFLS